ncbi:MAG: hypothetical protein MPEBLZ_03140 [Candidatus Methanoperedens nitroreducens]|uniref:Lipoprotein n=1 Tax=Candidatus Methanoperedens nitratireducens TaxID=1392998 RepID=A0A0P7ZCE2_9EURY|nr:MAG: hypothetical protein MPEBLZ_03140 [Candidatus Methanoperedens sp. BLZ1]
MKINKLYLIILVMLATQIISGCIDQSSITGSKNDYTPEDIVKTYGISGKLSSKAEAEEFFVKFYENSKTFPKEFIPEWIDGFGLNLENNTIDELKKNINEKTTAVFIANNTYYIYSLKNTTWVYFVANSNMNPIDRYLKEYTNKQKEILRERYKLALSDDLIEKTQTRRKTIEDFYNVQKKLLLKNATIKYNGDTSPQQLSDLINEFDPELVKNPNSNGILNENNIIIVRKKDIDYADDINNPTENLLYLYFRRPEPILIIDDKTMLIKYANFGGYDYSYRNIEYID